MSPVDNLNTRIVTTQEDEVLARLSAKSVMTFQEFYDDRISRATKVVLTSSRHVLNKTGREYIKKTFKFKNSFYFTDLTLFVDGNELPEVEVEVQSMDAQKGTLILKLTIDNKYLCDRDRPHDWYIELADTM